MPIEAIYIKKLKPQLNTRDEYWGRELTLKYYFKYKKFRNSRNSKIILVHREEGKEKNLFSGIENIITGIFKNSGIEINMISV